MVAQGSVSLAGCPGEGLGHQQRYIELAGQALEPRGEIDRRPDDSEVEAPATADIAIGDVAQMQPESASELQLALGAPAGIERGQALECRQGRAKGPFGRPRRPSRRRGRWREVHRP